MPVPPEPTNIRILRGNPQKRPLPKGEMRPNFDEAVPPPPAHLTAAGAAEWRRVGAQLFQMGLLSRIDYTTLAAYITAFQKWIDAEELLLDLRRAPMRGLLISRNSQAMINPLVTLSLRAAAEMVRISGEFGFSPAARVRIAMGVEAKEDFGKFNGLIAG